MNSEQRRARIERLYEEELDFREAMRPFHKAEMREALMLFGLGMLLAAIGIGLAFVLARTL
ncbi:MULTISPECIES: hypothetical protein [Pseudomonas]|uniref:DUF3094 domain-containing protein n=1 Tax=Pseudomonas hamedanensis TaxID=2745504 RepID=A0A9E6P1U0_9PSED|nr:MULTISPECIES: hypothetical protein [Pseudomonas]MBC3208955.1 hypothetical protein [Pseudomonas sp. SWRI111]MBC3272358.1 hypothetical protein [Pseudomonas sp. SWRI81]MBC3777630.1 hypothetical protein [Pseudomonas sp. SWRI99]QXI17818.1 hypothetical protein HU739_002130 [Pseudomonas hamedanensis]